MRRRARGAVAIALMMGLLPAMAFVSAEEAGEETVLIPITPADSASSYAVFFADNMAFGPQWRVGNLVRIEAMVLKIGDWNEDGVTSAADLPCNYTTNYGVNSTMDSDPLLPTTYTQSDLMAAPELILDTFMVSVPDIWVNISGEGLVFSFHSHFDADGTETTSPDALGPVGREINKAGHLIYGFQWDTTGAVPGDYKVTVDLLSPYLVAMAVEHLYPLVDETDDVVDEVDPIGYTEVPVYVDGSDDPSGTGGVNAAINGAYIYIGELISKGGSGSTGGNGGNGNGYANLGSASTSVKGVTAGRGDR